MSRQWWRPDIVVTAAITAAVAFGIAAAVDDDSPSFTAVSTSEEHRAPNGQTASIEVLGTRAGVPTAFAVQLPEFGDEPAVCKVEESK